MSVHSASTHVRALVARFDTLLRRCYNVHEFSTHPACLLRIAHTTARRDTLLADGTRIARGEPLLEIHLWNEHLPQMPREGADLAWARRMHQGFTHSLHLLAKYLALEPQLRAVRAIYGETGFLTSTDLDAGASALVRLGFEVHRLRAQAGPWRRFTEFWENVYSYALLWTFSPASLRGKPLLRLERCQLWMSRQVLEERYLRPREHP